MENFDFDVIVIGGGPAGIMASLSASENKKSVLLIDKNQRLGRKLLLTGKGRCNITHDEVNPKKLIEKYNKEGVFLLSGFSQFGVKETLDFFELNGLKLKVERGNRFFPELNDSESVLNFFEKKLKENGVRILTNNSVVNIIKANGKISKIVLKNEQEFTAKNYIIASGGCSYPITGSDGEMFKLVKRLGHKITELNPSLVGLKTKEDWCKYLVGLSLTNVNVKIAGTKFKSFGDLLFTHQGVSGPTILDLSSEVVKLLKKGNVKVSIDLKPALTSQALDARIQRDFAKYSNKQFKNALNDLLPMNLIEFVVKQSGINQYKVVNIISKKERQELVKVLKNLEITVNGHMGFDTAIVTSGGVDLSDVDQKTMKSKLVDNLFFAGEMLNIDGKTGGYNLQACWTTGHIAGKNASI